LPPSVGTLDDSVAPPRFHLTREHTRRERFAAVTWAEAVRPRKLVVGDDAGLYVTGLDGLALTQLRFDATQRYYHHDALGSTRALTAADGTVLARSDYDPYGNPTTPATPSNPFGYAGQYTDHTTDLIYMRAPSRKVPT
jgi:hypothetical protein